MTTTLAGLHEKGIERHIQAIKDRRRAMLAGLPYELPGLLESESYVDAITWINRVPNSQVGHISPHQLVTGQRSFLPRYHFGQMHLFYLPNKKASSSTMGPPPTCAHIFRLRSICTQRHIPTELSFVSRLRVALPSPRILIIDSSVAPLGNLDLQTFLFF